MTALAGRLADQYPASNKNNGISVSPYYELIVQNIRPVLYVLLAACGLLLIIACTNLASLMLARAEVGSVSSRCARRSAQDADVSCASCSWKPSFSPASAAPSVSGSRLSRCARSSRCVRRASRASTCWPSTGGSPRSRSASPRSRSRSSRCFPRFGPRRPICRRASRTRARAADAARLACAARWSRPRSPSRPCSSSARDLCSRASTG